MRSQVITAAAALAAPSSAQGLWSRDIDFNALSQALSSSAKAYYPGSAEFVSASTRWSNLDLPTANIVVSPATENDVVETVSLGLLYLDHLPLLLLILNLLPAHNSRVLASQSRYSQ